MSLWRTLRLKVRLHLDELKLMLAKSSKKFSVKKAVVSANDRRRIASAVSKFLKSKIA
jgi:hypothetical protein